MSEQRFTGLSVIVTLCGIGSIATFVSALNAEGVNALVAWVMFCLTLFICAGLFFHINSARIVAIIVFGLSVIFEIVMLALALIQILKNNEVPSLSTGLIGPVIGLGINVWVVWYLMKPTVKSVFEKQVFDGEDSQPKSTLGSETS